MVYDAIGLEFGIYNNEEVEEPPNLDAKNFYELLNAAQKPLWSGCVDHTELSFIVRLLMIKSERNISQRSFNQTVEIMKETLPPDNLVPKYYYRVKKIVSKLGFTAKKIDYCVNGYMLFYTEECKALKECTFYGAARYKLNIVGKGKYKDVPVKKMHYLSLIPRLKRLYVSLSSAPHMR